MGANTITELVQRSRSYRRFYGDRPIQRAVLEELVDLARCCPSARNLQPLRYLLSCELERNAVIFSSLTWPILGAWTQPSEEERPSAYILVLADTTIPTAIGIDCGIAAQTILLGAVERGLGGCIMAMVDRPVLQASLRIPTRYKILVVLALGQPKEQVIIEPPGPDGDLMFWRDENWIHHVPKRTLSDILLDGIK